MPIGTKSRYRVTGGTLVCTMAIGFIIGAIAGVNLALWLLIRAIR